MRDAIVIGAGLAGLMGALALAERGHKPLLLASGQGATHWAGGWIDLLAGPAQQSPRQLLGELIAQQPGHPYARVGLQGIEMALGRLQRLAADAGYPLHGSAAANLWLPTAVGAVRPTCLVPATMSAGDLRSLAPGDELLIAGFHELRDFFPPLIAANLSAQGYTARAVYLEIPAEARRKVFTGTDIARLFDQPAFRAAIGRQLRGVRGRARRIGLPAVLGLQHPLDVVADLQNASGALVFEIPTLPPSVPGMRLFQLLASAIERRGGRLQLGSQVQRAAAEGTRLRSVWTEAAAREQQHQSDRWVLATGGIAGGGLVADPHGAVRETALDLPVQAPEGRGNWFHARLLAASGHPIYRAGIAVNQRLRPLDAAGQVVYSNLTVAGAALAGFDPLREGCYEGVALATGWAAGHLLA